MPWIPSSAQGVELLVMGIAIWALSQAAAAVRRQLRSGGRLTALLHGAAMVGRGVALLLILGAIGSFLPPSLASALPWVMLATAVAVGWSAREPIADLVAGLLLATERRLALGQWLQVDGFEGRIETIGLRAVWLVDRHGHHIGIPNRVLLRTPQRIDLEEFTEFVVRLRLPPAPAARCRAALEEAALLSPWLAPGARPQVMRDPSDPTLWTVRARLLRPEYQARFEGALPDRLEILLAEPGLSEMGP